MPLSRRKGYGGYAQSGGTRARAKSRTFHLVFAIDRSAFLRPIRAADWIAHIYRPYFETRNPAC